MKGNVAACRWGVVCPEAGRNRANRPVKTHRDGLSGVAGPRALHVIEAAACGGLASAGAEHLFGDATELIRLGMRVVFFAYVLAEASAGSPLLWTGVEPVNDEDR
jgi:hypothetical protein